MPGRVKTTLQSLNARINWHTIGTLVGVTVFVIAVVTLTRMLRKVETGKIWDAILATPSSHMIAAGVCVAAAYVTLTFYDWFALRTIGRREVPYRVAALSAFTSYAIGHNIGATVFTANFIRFRMYAAYALSLIHI